MSDTDRSDAPLPAAEPPPERVSAAVPPTVPLAGPARGRRRLLLLLIAGLSGLIAIGCLGTVLLLALNPALRGQLALSAGLADPPPNGPDRFAPPPSGPVNISDTFTVPGNGWDRSQTEIRDGAYLMTLELSNFDSYGLFLGASSVQDFDLAVDATQVGGDPTAEYGIRFRQSAPDEHLIFSVSGTGFYRLARVSDKSYTALVPWTRDRRIRTGLGGVNRLRVVADGPTITAYINDAQVLQYSDPQPVAGQLTLGLVTFDVGGLRVRFDNLAGFAVGDAGQLDLAQDFSDPVQAPWSLGGATISGGAYEVFVGGPVQSWQEPLPIGSSEVQGDFTLEVDATLVEGDEDSGYGVIFADGGAFDFFAIYLLPQGGLTIIRNGPDGGVLLPPTPLDVVKPGLNETNTLRIEVKGSKLLLTINGQALPELDFGAETSLKGMAGMIVQSGGAGVRARFDNFKLSEGAP